MVVSPLFKDLGIGVGLRPAHYADFIQDKPKSVSWVEVISENYLPLRNQDYGKTFQKLLKIREDYPVALHGVSLNLGACDHAETSQDYLKKIKDLIHHTQPIIVSDHLSWTGVGGVNLHDLMPIPYTEESLKVLTENIDRVQNFIGQRILIENPSSYLEFNESQITEWDFINELTNRSDCGILLDVNNIYVSSVNHSFDPNNYLRAIPAHRVGQIHLAGHSIHEGYLIDTHDAPVCKEVWDLYREALALIGPKSAMIERDGNIPEWQELQNEVLQLKEIRDEVLTKSS